MNIETGEIKSYDELTPKQQRSGKWVPLTEDRLRALAQLETERLARRNKGVTTGQIDARIARAEARRQRKARDVIRATRNAEVGKLNASVALAHFPEVRERQIAERARRRQERKARI